MLGGMKGCYGTVVRKGDRVDVRPLMMHYPLSQTDPVCMRMCMSATLQCIATETAANRLIFRGSLIRPNPRLSLTPTVSFVMY